MKSFLTIIALLVWLPALASASALKGVRGHKRALQTAEPPAPVDKMEKKCKKYAEPKVDPKATKEDPKAGAKASDDKAGDAKAGDAKATDPKATSDKADKEDKKEAECLEWFEEQGIDRDDEGGSSVVTDPTMTSTGTSLDQINVDCDAIANDKGPTDGHSVSFSVNIDVVKDAESTLNDIYSAMEKELQTKVAPRIAGCSSGRLLASGSQGSKIVHVDFGELEFDRRGCDSALNKEAAQYDGVCMASDLPVDVYFVGDFPENAIKKVEVAIEEHAWDVDGLIDTSEVAIVQTGSSMGSNGGAKEGGMIGGIVAAIVACLCGGCGYMAYKRRQDPVAKAELDTDEESDDEDNKKKVAVPEVVARPVR